MKKNTNIAKKVIDKCGGVAAIASWLGITTKSVHCWKYPKSKGGSGGIIPAKYQYTLLRKANKNGISLSPGDFF